MPDAPSFEEQLARQLEMNRLTWQTLLGNGYTPGRLVCLDFFYWAPGRREATALRRFIFEETDYDVQATTEGPLFGRRWKVTGTTRETEISLEILDQWVGWWWPPVTTTARL